MDTANKNCWTPIYAAAEEGYVEVVRELLYRGARMDISDEQGWILIYAAAKYGRVEVVRELLNRGARLPGARKPEYVASQRGHIEAVRDDIV